MFLSTSITGSPTSGIRAKFEASWPAMAILILCPFLMRTEVACMPIFSSATLPGSSSMPSFSLDAAYKVTMGEPVISRSASRGDPS